MRSHFPDPTRQVLVFVWPLCLIDMIAWKFYVGGVAGGLGAGFFFTILIASIIYLKKTS